MRYTTRINLTAQELLDRAQVYFGPRGKGLHLISERRHALTFRGGGGHVAMDVQAKTPHAPIRLQVETYQWDEAVQQFISGLPYDQTWWQRWWPWGQSSPTHSWGKRLSHPNTGRKTTARAVEVKPSR